MSEKILGSLATGALLTMVVAALAFTGPGAAAAAASPLASAPGGSVDTGIQPHAADPSDSADPAPGGSATPTQTPSVPPVEPPTITSPDDGAFTDDGRLTVRGTKAQGAGIQLLIGSSGEPACIVDADDSTSWECSISVSDGPGIVIRAAQTGLGDTLTTQLTVSSLSAPVISPTDVTNGGVRGTGYPGATVTATADDGSSCSFPADASGSWFCVLGEGLSSGRHTITATQTASFTNGKHSAASAPITVTIDRDAPAAPVITSPVVGTLMPLGPSSYTGTGEDGATVTVFADSTSVCSAVVTGGQWSCQGAGVPEGPHLVLAIQQDLAGNTSGASAAFTLRYASPSTASPAPTPGPTSAAPVVPAPGTPGASPAPSPSQTGRPDASGPAPSFGGGGGGSGPWASATPFTATLAGSADGRGQPVWWVAVLLALAALLLIAIPTRMLASSVGPALRAAFATRRAPLTGRNRSRSEFESAPRLGPPSTVIVAVTTAVLASGFVILAHPVEGQPAYLRLWGASLAAIVLVNTVAVGAQFLLARFARFGPLQISPAPRWILTVGAVSMLSRFLGLQPALLFGLIAEARPVKAPTEVEDSPAADPAITGRLAHVRISAAAAIGALAWLVSAVMAEPVGAAQSFVTEVVNVTAMAGIGSAAIALLPIGSLGGLAVFRWSRSVWSLTALAAFTLLFGLLGPAITAAGSAAVLTSVVIVVLIFAAVGATAWAWTRYLRPMLEQAG